MKTNRRWMRWVLEATLDESAVISYRRAPRRRLAA